jgi:RimJ/RimL family protein N-acetyltransferase
MVPPGSERLVLRRLTTADVDLLVDLDSDPEVLRYISRSAPSYQEVAALVAALVSDYARHPRWGRWAALDSATGDFAGWFALSVDGPGVLDLGYRLRRPFWGRGLASEMSRALVAYAFEDPSIDRVVARTMAVNHRSRRVMENAGLTYRRTFHPHFDDPLPGTDLGEVEYEIRPRP